MVKRSCPKCNASFDRKSNYDYHINRKFDCVQSDNKPDDLVEEKTDGLKICRNLQEFAGICKNEKIVQKKCENLTGVNDVCFSCSYCNKSYSSKYTLLRHLSDNCRVKKENDDEKENIFKLLLEKDKQHKEEVNELKKQNKLLMDRLDKLINLKENSKPTKTSKISNTQNTQNIMSNSNNLSNSNNTTNTQNNLIINFGKEDLGIIDRQMFLDRVIKNNRLSGVKIPDEILRIIHFNPNYPQLSNIYISDINREKCMVYEDNEWKLSPIDKIPEVIEKVITFSNDVENELREKYPNNKRLNDRFDVINKYNNMNNDEYIEELKENFEENKDLIKRCENFQKMTYDTFKTTMYNEGKKIKKNIK
jgi:hypothetical protein